MQTLEEIKVKKHEWYLLNREDQRSKARKRWKEQRGQVLTNEKWLRRTFAEVKYRARKREIEFNLLTEHITEFPIRCPILGFELDYQRGHKNGKYKENSASLDRIDSLKGYQKGNVHICSWRANVLKNQATIDEMIILGNWALKRKDNSE